MPFSKLFHIYLTVLVGNGFHVKRRWQVKILINKDVLDSRCCVSTHMISSAGVEVKMSLRLGKRIFLLTWSRLIGFFWKFSHHLSATWWLSLRGFHRDDLKTKFNDCKQVHMRFQYTAMTKFKISKFYGKALIVTKNSLNSQMTPCAQDNAVKGFTA